MHSPCRSFTPRRRHALLPRRPDTIHRNSDTPPCPRPDYDLYQNASLERDQLLDFSAAGAGRSLDASEARLGHRVAGLRVHDPDSNELVDACLEEGGHLAGLRALRSTGRKSVFSLFSSAWTKQREMATLAHRSPCSSGTPLHFEHLLVERARARARGSEKERVYVIEICYSPWPHGKFRRWAGPSHPPLAISLLRALTLSYSLFLSLSLSLAMVYFGLERHSSFSPSVDVPVLI